MERPPQKLPMAKPLPPEGISNVPPQRQKPNKPPQPAANQVPQQRSPYASGPPCTPKTSGGSILLILLGVFGGGALLVMLACGGFFFYVKSNVEHAQEEFAQQQAAHQAARQEVFDAFEQRQANDQRNNPTSRPDNPPWRPSPVRPEPKVPTFDSAEAAATALGGLDRSRRREAMEYLREQPRSDDAIPEVLSQINNDDASVRQTARELLTQWEVDETTYAAQNLKDLQSGGDFRANEAAKWFAQHGVADEVITPQVAPALIALINNRNTRNDSVAALQVWATAENVPALIEAASTAHADLDRDAEKATVELLTNFNDARALPTYAAYLETRHDRNVARAAFAAVGVDGAKTLLPFIHDNDSSTRQIARELLGEWEVEKAHWVTQSIADLESGEQSRQLSAMQYLNDVEPDDANREVVAQALIGLIDEQRLRHEALRSLKIWASAATVPQLIDMLDHEDGNVNKQARSILVATKDPRAVAPIAAGFGDDFFKRTEARRNLVAMGPVAEAALWPHVTHQDWRVAKEACEVLGEIGTDKSIPALQTAANHSSSFVKKASANAIVRIQESDRVAGPMPGVVAGEPAEPADANPDAEPAEDAAPEMRTWTDATGTNKIEAEFVEFALGKVRLRTAQGKTLSLKMNQLSAADREYVIGQVQRER